MELSSIHNVSILLIYIRMSIKPHQYFLSYASLRSLRLENIPRTFSAVLCQENFCACAISLPANSWCKSSLIMTELSFSVNSPGAAGLQYIILSSATSRCGGISDATTGTPSVIASRIVIPKPSYKDGLQKTALALNSAGLSASSTKPVKVTSLCNE